MYGLNRNSGAPLLGIDHLRQSIVDILTTPIGSRVMRREYGSRLYQLIDAPLNRQTIVDIYTATAEALLRWEPRLNVTRVHIENIESGWIQLAIEGEYRPTQTFLRLENLSL